MTQAEKSDGAGKSPKEIEAELDKTREAISRDLDGIGEKLSVENLKKEAKEMMGEAKEAAKLGAHELIDDLKTSAVGSLKEAKDSAIEKVEQVVGDVGQGARRAGNATLGFIKENPIPLVMVGIGLGWLAVSMTRRRRPIEIEEDWLLEETGPRRVPVAKRVVQTASEVVHSAGHKASEAMHTASEKASEAMHTASEKAGQLAQGAQQSLGHASERARQLGRSAKAGVQRAETSVTDFAYDNPLALGAAALAAGVGVGLLIPSTNKEDELLGGARDRLVSDVRGSAEELGRAVKGTAEEIRTALR